MNYTPVQQAYQEALQADKEWSAALKKAFKGKAGDVRYTVLGETHPDCAQPYQRYRETRDKWMGLVRIKLQGERHP